jgi:hypothetical protein
MGKEQVLRDSKNYLISVHDTLLKAFRNAPGEEKVFIDNVLKDIEKDVEQLELLEDMMRVWKITKKKKLEMIEEG